MKQLYWQTIGKADRHIVLLHGWGLNAQVWRYIAVELSAHFCVHRVDLPGFGASQGYGALSLAEMTQQVLLQAPAQAVWLGWSLGGLVASQAALCQPQRIQALITVASSPCFVADGDWPGIAAPVLADFQQRLSLDYQQTVERFLALQTLGSISSRQDLRELKAVVLSYPQPDIAVLNGGLAILQHSDLRSELAQLRLPFLRIYGYLDALVPRKVATMLDQVLPASPSLVMAKAAHAPFISHPDQFCQSVCRFITALPQ